MASKEHLPEFLRTAGLTDAAPATFRLPEDMELARAALTRDPLHDASGLPTWMLKSKQHRNIRPLLNSTSEHLASQSPALLQDACAAALPASIEPSTLGSTCSSRR